MKPSRIALVAITLAGLAGAGCGGDKAAEASVSTPVAATPEVPAEQDTAAQQDLAIATPLNRRVKATLKRALAAGEAGNWDGYADEFDAYAHTLEAGVAKIVAIEYPPRAQAIADALVRSSARLVSASRDVASSARRNGEFVSDTLASDFSQAWADQGADVQLLRARLGLPPPK